MGDKTKIEWCDSTWNPVRGCTQVSTGCKNCYAERFAKRWGGIPGHPFEQGFDVRLVPSALGLPERWKQPRRIFVNSMSDLFHEDVPFNFIALALAVMQSTPRHTYHVLTKRPARMNRVYEWLANAKAWTGPSYWTLHNLWLGVSVEDRRSAEERIPLLIKTPAAHLFLSIEPLLEDLGTLDLRGIDWVIVGGESGPGARPMHTQWAIDIVQQCRKAKVKVFMKQMGTAWARGGTGSRTTKGQDPREWPEDLRIQEMPE
jgi:protein gp37